MAPLAMKERPGPISFLSRLSTGIKTFILLAVALFPLGLIALFASWDASSNARGERIDEARLITELAARRMTETIERSTLSLRVASTAVDPDAASPGECRELLATLSNIEQAEVRLAIFRRNGELICASNNFPAALRFDAPPGRLAVTQLDSETGTIRIRVNSEDGRTFGLAILPRSTVAERTRPIEQIENYLFTLRQGDTSFLVHPWSSDAPSNPVRSTQQLADGQIEFDAAFEVVPLRTSEWVAIILPLLMWAAGALLGWFAVNRLVLRPLARLQGAVSRFNHDEGDFIVPATRSPAAEIRELGTAFHAVVSDLKANETAMANALGEQARLTREVHHRVKNNLQIVASLLNLHARSAVNADTATAYASIKRRVDALAIVQRNLLGDHGAEIGTSLRPIVSELVSTLQQGGPEHVRVSISLDIVDVRVAQEIAVAVCFYLTELVELSFFCAEAVDLSIKLEPIDEECASLTLESEALKAAPDLPAYPRYRRVIEGLARQLRAPVEQNSAETRYEIKIPIL